MDRNSKIRAAVVMDEISIVSFAREWEVISLTTTDWYKEVNDFLPEVLFVESAWRGADGRWGRVLVNAEAVLGGLIYWCKKNKVVTVFWNKEDPIHFKTFIKAAALFDWVFTTDLDCLPLYKKTLGHSKIGLLMFAADITMFHPMEQEERQEAIAFAGSYYKKRKKRCEEFEHMLDWSKDYLPVAIYDRKSEVRNACYRYPSKYQESIMPARPMEEMPGIYKKYRYHVTVNTVTNSTTMEARRIFELMASNTLVISNECLAVHILFGSLVLYCNEEQKFREQIRKLPYEREFYNQCRLKALRKVLLEHTFHARIRRIEEAIGKAEKEKEESAVTVLAAVKSKRQQRAIEKAFGRQTYGNKSLVVFPEGSKSEELIRTLAIENDRYYAFFSPKNYYGENYLLDLMLATRYSESDIVGKGCFFMQKGALIKRKGEEARYRYVDHMEWDRCLMRGKRLAEFLREEADYRKSVPGKAASIDEYNFCANRKRRCRKAAEMEIDSGHAVAELYEREKEIREGKM